MGAIVVVLLLALVLAAVVVLYVAYPLPRRGRPRHAPARRGDATGVESLPTLDTRRAGRPTADAPRRRSDALSDAAPLTRRSPPV